MVSSWIRDYLVGSSSGYPFGVVAGSGRDGVYPRTAHISSHKSDFWLDSSDSVSSQSSDYPAMNHSTKYW